MLRHSPHTSVNILKLLKDEYLIADVTGICSIQNKKKFRKKINTFASLARNII